MLSKQDGKWLRSYDNRHVRAKFEAGGQDVVTLQIPRDEAKELVDVLAHATDAYATYYVLSDLLGYSGRESD